MPGEGKGGRSKGDETVGVCNCSGFNALLMADGTRDWGNGLHQMSLLARRAERRQRKLNTDEENCIREDIVAREARGFVVFPSYHRAGCSPIVPFLAATVVGIDRYISLPPSSSTLSLIKVQLDARATMLLVG